MRRVIVIPARYASTRLPGKPLAPITGKPLIQWVYERAGTSTLKQETLIATDDARIRDAAVSFGASVVMTPVDCASGTDRVHEAIKGRDADIIVNVQGDEPSIRGDMIDTLFSVIEEESLDMATLCTPVKDKSELNNPHTVKVVLDQHGFALYFSRSLIPFPQKPAGADVYKHIGIYGFSRSFLERFVNLPKGKLEQMESLEQLRALEAGYKIKVLVVEYDGVSVDTPEDLARATSLLSTS
ncbi:MAG TPA: 3-deoxy-manno-octulosonate cytidylyltransferase [Syntrophorhabdales bacterium]|nr:3-deoxy-manno-octulosonate cytidylyltransferase [Syntrophorhabdales bacterium]